MADERLTEWQKLANELELKYWEKRESFWQRIFMGCSGFVAVVTPIALQVSVPDKVRHYLFGAVIAAALCAVLLVGILYRSIRYMNELLEKAKESARSQGNVIETNPKQITTIEKLFALGSVAAIIIAFFCMIGAFVFSW